MIVVELFPCSGGMAEGLRRAGLKPTISFDWDEDACASYEKNLGDRPIRMDVRDLLRLARDVQHGWRPLERVDLLVADPPCTPWSRAGKRQGTDDERDLIEETVELVWLLRPRAWLIANVPGLDDGPNWQTVQRTIGSLAGAGYCIDFARLDAADYGVPQHRVRPFWYGHAPSEPHVVWPARTHGSPDECSNHTLAGVAALRPWVTCREALAHLPPGELGTPIRLRYRGCKGNQIASVPDRPARVVGTSNLSDGNVLAHPEVAKRKTRPSRKPRASESDAPAGVVTTSSNGNGGVLLTNHKHPINRIDEPSMTVCTKGDMQGAQGAAILEWPWDRPSTSVTVDERIAPPGHSSEDGHERHGRARHNAVKLSEKAASILQGFPDGWHFAGKTKSSRWAQIGMAMPPPLAEAVARSIARALTRRAEVA